MSREQVRVTKVSSMCQGLEKCLGLGLSTSRSRSRLGPKIERLGLDLVKSGKVSVSVSSRTGSQTSRSRLGLGPQCLFYIPGLSHQFDTLWLTIFHSRSIICCLFPSFLCIAITYILNVMFSMCHPVYLYVFSCNLCNISQSLWYQDSILTFHTMFSESSSLRY